MPYIPIAKARGFTAHQIKFDLKNSVNYDNYQPYIHELIPAEAVGSLGQKFATTNKEFTHPDGVRLMDVKEDAYVHDEFESDWQLQVRDIDEIKLPGHAPVDTYFIHYMVEIPNETEFVDYKFHGTKQDYTYHYELDQPDFIYGDLKQDVPFTTPSGLTVTLEDKGFTEAGLQTSSGVISEYGDPEGYGDFYYIKVKVENNGTRDIDLSDYYSRATAFFSAGSDYIFGSARSVAMENSDHTDIIPPWDSYGTDLDSIKVGETGYLYAGCFIDEDQEIDISQGINANLTILEDIFHIPA